MNECNNKTKCGSGNKRQNAEKNERETNKAAATTTIKTHTLRNGIAMITKYIIIHTNRWLWNINIYLFYGPVVNSALYLHLHM